MDIAFWGYCMICGKPVYGQDICERCWEGNDKQEYEDSNDYED